MLSKNDIVTVTIEDMNADGMGVGIFQDQSTGKACGFVLFIKDTVIGDTVEAKVVKLKKSYGYARLQKILVPSKSRVPAKCPVARQCGGCQLQEMEYGEQLAFKQKKVKNNLLRLGGLSEENGDYIMHPIAGMENPYYYRNKAQFPVGAGTDGSVRIGFYAGRTHNIIDNTDCCIGHPANRAILESIRTWIKDNALAPYNEQSGTGLIRHILIRTGFATKEIGVCLVINAPALPQKAATQFISVLRSIDGISSIMLNINTQRTNVILGDTCSLLWGKPYIEDCIGSIRYRISPLSFYQVNPVQTKKMYDTVLTYAQLTGKETVWDLYCGIGTISLYLAKSAARVYGVEVVPSAVENAKENAKLNGISNAEFILGKAEEVVTSFGSNIPHPDVVVVDPPRKGCDASLLNTILSLEPERIVYVSCDSATLARDMKLLKGSGKHMVRDVQCFDNFCQGVHVECVVLMSRVEGK